MRTLLGFILAGMLSTCGMMVPALAATHKPKVCETVQAAKALAVTNGLNWHRLPQSEVFVVEAAAKIGPMDAVYLLDDGHKFALVAFRHGCVFAFINVDLGTLEAISKAAQGQQT